ncbi:MAG: 6-phosphogluconolactonase, partial [Phycisphaerales bacterium]|nr:6-phosphogluconolactonase [Phycisphaerales bacterium]
MACDESPPDPLGDSSIYELEDDVAPPRLPGDVVVRDDEEAVHSALAADLLVHAGNCVRSFGDFHLALSGGSSPMPFYRRLMVDPAYREFPWRRTHLWIVDERCVPFDDPMSNFGQIRDYLVGHSDIPAANVHPMEATLPDAPERYEREIQAVLAWREKGQDRLDFVLLGMGGDGHTASLFPGSAALDLDDRLVTRVHVEGIEPPDRITMTYRLINGARLVAVLVKG